MISELLWGFAAGLVAGLAMGRFIKRRPRVKSAPRLAGAQRSVDTILRRLEGEQQQKPARETRSMPPEWTGRPPVAATWDLAPANRAWMARAEVPGSPAEDAAWVPQWT